MTWRPYGFSEPADYFSRLSAAHPSHPDRESSSGSRQARQGSVHTSDDEESRTSDDSDGLERRLRTYSPGCTECDDWLPHSELCAECTITVGDDIFGGVEPKIAIRATAHNENAHQIFGHRSDLLLRPDPIGEMLLNSTSRNLRGARNLNGQTVEQGAPIWDTGATSHVDEEYVPGLIANVRRVDTDAAYERCSVVFEGALVVRG